MDNLMQGELRSGHNYTIDDLDDLYRTVAALRSRVDALSTALSSTTRLTFTLSASLTKDQENLSIKAKERVLLFARRNAVQALRAGHAELARKIPRSQLCASNSVVQVIVKTKASDCTLADFRILTKALMQEESFHCNVFPSMFYAEQRDEGKCKRIDLTFPSYFDICQALSMNVDIREEGVYKVRTFSSQLHLKAFQVMGVNAPDKGTDLSRARRIILGKSDPTVSTDGRAHVLYQKSMSWTESSCDFGFAYREEALCHIATISKATLAPSSMKRSSLIDQPPNQRNVYRITWLRNSDSAAYDHVPPEKVSGIIRSFFPAVIVRAQLLTTTAQSIFNTRIGDKCLKQILVSPSREI